MGIHGRNFSFVICLAAVCCIGVKSDNNGKKSISEVDSEFDCNGKIGFYADVNKNCSIFYYCQWDSAKITLSCPEDTWFNQKHLQCEGGDRKHCLKSKKYYHGSKRLIYDMERPKQNVSKERQEKRFKRQALYLPPSTLNTFVVRYYMPTAAASVSEQDTFGSNAAIYLPENYRVAVNPDAEQALQLGKPAASKDQYSKKIHYIAKDPFTVTSTTKLPRIKVLQESAAKPIVHSTRRPEPIRRPDTERIIHPPNYNGYDRDSQYPRSGGNDYKLAGTSQPHDASVQNGYQHSRYSVPSRNEGTYIHHPRKAGQKVYHPAVYSSTPQYHRPSSLDRDYDYIDASYHSPQPKYIHRYPGDVYGHDEDDDYYYTDRPRNTFPSSGYSHPIQRPPYPSNKPYPEYPRGTPYNVNPNTPGHEEPVYGGQNENHYRGTDRPNWPPKPIDGGDHKNEDNINYNQRPNSNIPPPQHSEQEQRNAVRYPQDSRNTYDEYERPRSYEDEETNRYRENEERHRGVPFVQYLDGGTEEHEPDKANPSQEQAQHSGREYDSSQRGKLYYKENQEEGRNNAPESLDKFQEQTGPKEGYRDGPKEDERDYKAEEISDDRRQPTYPNPANHQQHTYDHREHSVQQSEQESPPQPFIERKPVEKLKGLGEKQLPLAPTEKHLLQDEDYAKVSGVPLKDIGTGDQSRTQLQTNPDHYERPPSHSQHINNNNPTLSLNQPADSIWGHTDVPQVPPSQGQHIAGNSRFPQHKPIDNIRIHVDVSQVPSIQGQHTEDNNPKLPQIQPVGSVRSNIDVLQVTPAPQQIYPAISSDDHKINNHQTAIKLSVDKIRPPATDDVFIPSERPYPNKNEGNNKNVYSENNKPFVTVRVSNKDKTYIGSTHYITNNKKTKNKLVASSDETWKDLYTTTEPSTTFSLFGSEKFGERIVKPKDDSAELKEPIGKENYHGETILPSRSAERYHSTRPKKERARTNHGRSKESRMYDKATPTYAFTPPYVQYKATQSKERQLSQSNPPEQIVPLHVSGKVIVNPTHPKKDSEEEKEHTQQSNQENHRSVDILQPVFHDSPLLAHNTAGIAQSPFDNRDTQQKFSEVNQKDFYHKDKNNEDSHSKLSVIDAKVSMNIHKDKAIIGRTQDLQYSDPNLSAAQDKVPTYVTVTPPITISDTVVTQPFILTDIRTATAATYPLTYDTHGTTEAPPETSTIRIRKQKRRRKKGRRRRPKRPRVQTQEQTQQKHAEHQLSYTSSSGETGSTAASTSAEHRYGEGENARSSEIINAELRNHRIEVEVTTKPMPTAQPYAAGSQNKGNDSGNPATEGPVERARKRQVKYRNRKRKYSRERTQTTTTTPSPVISEESSPEKSFMYQGMGEVTSTSQPTTPYRPARTRVMRQKTRSRPRLFGFGKPKPATDNPSIVTTTTSAPS